MKKSILARLSALVPHAGVAIALIASHPFAQAELSIVVSEDALINSTDAQNYNTGVYFDLLASETGPASPGGYWGSWLKFDLTSLGGRPVSSAFLDLTTNYNHSATPIAHEVFSSTNDTWSAQTITGQNQPGPLTLASQDTQVIPAIDAVYTWNVTEAVNTVGTSDGVLTLFIRPSVYPADDDYRGPHFYSVEAGISPPVLRISPVPEPLSAAMLLVGLALVVPVARRQVRGG